MKLKQAKVYSKKTLSVLLATIMLIMTCSVAFGVSAFTGTDTSAISKLNTMLTSDDYYSLLTAIYNQDNSVLTYSSSNSYTIVNSNETHVTTTVSITDYEDYVAFNELVEAVWYAADYVYRYNASDSFRNNGVYNPSCEGTDKTYGENIYSLAEGITTHLTTNHNLSTTGQAYLAALLNIVFTWPTIYDSSVSTTSIAECLDNRGYDDSSWSNSLDDFSSTEYSYLKFNLEVYTTDAVGWLEYSENDAEDYDDMTLKSTYQVSMHRVSYNSGQRRFWGVDVELVSTSSAYPITEATSYATTIINVANSYKKVLSEALADYPTFEDVYDLCIDYPAVFESTKSVIEANYAALVNAVSDADSDTSDEAKIIASMFADSSDYADLISNFEVAETYGSYVAVADAMEEMEVSTDYGTFNALAFDRTTIIADYATYKANYNILNNLTDDAYEYITSENNITEAYYTNFTNNVNAYYAQDTEDSLDALLTTYGGYTQEEVEAMDSTVMSAVYTQFSTLLTKAESYNTVVYDAIFTDGLEKYYTVSALFECGTNSTVAYFVEMGLADLTEYSTDYLIECLDDYASDYAKLETLKATVAENTENSDYADEVFTTVYEYADGLCERIYKALAEIFTQQVDYAVSVAPANLSADDMTPYLYGTLKLSIGAIDEEIYDITAIYTYLSQETIDNYKSLLSIIAVYTAYASTFGFSDYEETVLEYDDREVYDTDVLKTETYEVDSDGVSSIITLLDSLLTNSEVIELLADLLGMTVSATEASLGEIVQALVSDMLFSDSIINMIVGFLYPLIESEFNGVDLPAETSGFTVSYEKTLAACACDSGGTSSGEGGFAIDPQSLAWMLDSTIAPTYSGSTYDELNYASFMADGIAQLYAAGTNWYSSEIYDVSTGTWTINWGMDDYKEANPDATFDELADQFIDSLGAALHGVYPLLKALLLGQSWYSHRDDLASASYSIFPDVADINLILSATANDGYVNFLGPIFEALGYYDYADTTECNSIANSTGFIQMAFDDIYATIENLLTSPVENILTILPSVVYALMFDMIPSLMSMLSTTIDYDTEIEALGSIDVSSLVSVNGSIPVDLGEMINLADMGLDTSGGLTGILEMFGIELSGLNEGILATLGTCDVVFSNRTASIYGLSSGQAYQITGNSEAVLYYLLTWLLDSIKNGSFYELLGAFVDDDTIAMIEEYVGYTGIAINESGDVIAAVVELLNSGESFEDAVYFTVSKYDNLPWYEDEDGTIKYGAYGYYYNEESGYFEPIDYSDLYTEYWTQEKAEYVVNDLPNYITEIASLFGLDTEIIDLLTSTVDDLLLTVFSTDMLDTVLDFVQPLVQEYAVDDDTISMIVDLLDAMELIDQIDISDAVDHILNFEYEDFEDGDGDAFLEAVVDFLEPFVPVLDFLLISSDDDGDLSLLSDEDGNATISFTSNNGYESALIPLLENLGCDSSTMTSYDEYITLTNTEKLEAILAPICDLLDTYLAGEDEYAIFGVLSIVPNILYFINGDNVNTLIANFLQPVYAILDTIRPIYSLDFTLDFSTEYIMTLLSDLINDLVASAGIEDYVGITIDVSAVMDALLEYGYTEERDSVTGSTYNYFVLGEETYAQMLTVTLDAILEEVVFGEEIQQYIDLLGSLGSLLGDDSEIGVLLTDLSEMESSDQVMLVLYYLAYGLEAGTDIYDSMSDTVKDFLIGFIGTDSEYFNSIFDRTSELLDKLGAFFNSGDDDYDTSTDETLNWFQQILADIKAFFEKIFAWLSF